MTAWIVNWRGPATAGQHLIDAPSAVEAIEAYRALHPAREVVSVQTPNVTPQTVQYDCSSDGNRFFHTEIVETGKNDWRPIETAPQDGSKVLVTGIGDFGWFMTDAKWLHGAWHIFHPDEDDYTVEIFNPTHWMPLPPPPHGASASGAN